MADERQILIASLREHFEGIVEAADLYLQGLSSEMAGKEELEAARGANSVLKSECSDWRKRAIEANKMVKDLKHKVAKLEERCIKTHQLCFNVIESLSSYEPELYKKYQAALQELEASSTELDRTTSDRTEQDKNNSDQDSEQKKSSDECAVESAVKLKNEPAQIESTQEETLVSATGNETDESVTAVASTDTAVPAASVNVNTEHKEPGAQVESEVRSAVDQTAEIKKEADFQPITEIVPSVDDMQHKVRADNKAALKKLIRVSMSSGRGLKGIKAAEVGRKKVSDAKGASETSKESAEADSTSSSDKTEDTPDPPEGVAPGGSIAATSSSSVNFESLDKSDESNSNFEPVADQSRESEAVKEEFIENNSRLKLPFLTKGRLKDSLEVALDKTLGGRLNSIEDIVNQTETDVKLSNLELLSQFGEDIHFIVSEDKQLIEEVKVGLDLSEKGEYDAALAKFAKLLRQDGALLQPCLAILHTYVNIARWEDAYKTGISLVYDTYPTQYWDKYIADMVQVLVHKLESANSDVEIKRLIFELALLHAKYPVTARKFLSLASSISEKIREDAAIHYYLLKLGVSSDSVETTIEALQEITCCPELFDELFMQAKKTVNRSKAPILNMIEALYLNSKEEAKKVEDRSVSLVPLGPVQISPSDIERFHSQATSGKVLSFMLDELFPRSEFSPPVWPERFKNILESSKIIPLHFGPAKVFERLNARTFKFKGVELRYYDGKELFFVKAAESEEGKTFILHAKLAELTPVEQQFIILRKCFQLYHRHTRLWHARLSLDDTMVCRLLSTVVEMSVENGAEVSASLIKVVKNYDADTSNLYRRISETITRLYRATGDKHFLSLKEFLFAKRPFTSTLDGDANRFAAKSVGITEASYGLARLFAGMRSDYDVLANNGFCALYADLQPKDEFLRKSLQLLWTSYLSASNYI
ncbi:MAG: hypothetical protein ACI376_04200 [Candidatus Bruticola sp.]